MDILHQSSFFISYIYSGLLSLIWTKNRFSCAKMHEELWSIFKLSKHHYNVKLKFTFRSIITSIGHIFQMKKRHFWDHLTDLGRHCLILLASLLLWKMWSTWYSHVTAIHYASRNHVNWFQRMSFQSFTKLKQFLKWSDNLISNLIWALGPEAPMNHNNVGSNNIRQFHVRQSKVHRKYTELPWHWN